MEMKSKIISLLVLGSIFIGGVQAHAETIDNSSNTSTCELSEALHRPILRKAVDLAKQVWLK